VIADLEGRWRDIPASRRGLLKRDAEREDEDRVARAAAPAGRIQHTFIRVLAFSEKALQ
jgi:hypothetical protein